jgi:CcmD family protein
MGGWGFVGAAYGIVWGAIVVYLFSLKRRYDQAATELAQIRSSEATADDEKK